MATIDRRGATVSAADPPISTNPNPDLAIKAPVRAATTANINLQTIGLATLDGVALAAGDRVLVKDQTDQTTNGLYNAATSVWTRTIDANNNSEFAQGLFVLVTSGTANGQKLFQLTSANPITLGTTAITFVQLTTNATIALTGDVTGSGATSIATALAWISRAAGKTLTLNNSLTLAGTDGKTLTISNSGTIAGGDAFTLAIAASKTLTVSNSGTLAGGDAFTLAIAANKTLTCSNTLTFTATDGSSVAFSTGGTALFRDATATITKGYTITPNNIGTVSSGTTTPDPTLGNYQFLTNNGAFTLAAPGSDCAIDILITNGASAGTITFSGFTVGTTGDALTTTNGNKFILSIRRINSVATYTIKALQ